MQLKNKIPVYESVGYKTQEVDPKVWKRAARARQRVDGFGEEDTVNMLINHTTQPLGTPNSYLSSYNNINFRGKKYYKSKDLNNYDHGVNENFIIKNWDKRNIRSFKGSLKLDKEKRAGNL